MDEITIGEIRECGGFWTVALHHPEIKHVLLDPRLEGEVTNWCTEHGCEAFPSDWTNLGFTSETDAFVFYMSLR